MDFEHAAQRLARDHSKLRDRRKERNKRGGLVLSETAKRQADEQRQRHARVRQARDTHQHNAQYRRQYMHACQRSFQETAVVAAATGSSSSRPVEAGATATHRMFTPTSIYGDGDKITLPPSVLETLMQHSSNGSGSSGTPWTFRIGILNPNYTVIPSSPLIQQLEAPHKEKEGEDYMDMDMDLEEEEEEEEDAIAHKMQPYLDELSYKYLSYTHCTVVEFTQDEGCIGIPTRIAQALLDPNNQHRRYKQQEDTATSTPATTSTSTIAATRTIVTIPTKRTIDPAVAAKKERISKEQHNNDEQDTRENMMQLDDTTTTATAAAADNGQEDRETENSNNNNNTTTEAGDAAGMESGTPGHVAWGTFDLPDTDLALTLVTLPKGTRCTLVPTSQAVAQNFYALKDVKLVLEQSLIRTRATLSLGDLVTTWHRGIHYDLLVTAVFPATYQAVTCINTDIEVEIGTTAPAATATAKATNSSSLVSSSTSTGVVANTNDVPIQNEKGYRLGRATSTCSSGGDDNNNNNSTNNNNNNNSMNNKNTANNTHATTNSQKLASQSLLLDLPPEPPLEQKEKVCTVQIRYQNCRGKRRFGLDTATVSELFAFAASVMREKKTTHVPPNNFKLVTRFPRRELCLVDEGRSSSSSCSTKNPNTNNDDIGTTANSTSNHNMVRASGALTLDQVGLKSGQELFMVEDL